MWKKAETHLKSRDPKLAGIMEKVGPCTLKPFPEPFTALVQSVVAQQLSTKAASTIMGRLRGLFPDPAGLEPDNLIRVSPEDMRGAGLSRPKIKYLKEIAEKAKQGVLHRDRFRDLPDEEVIRELVRIKGVGRWTAEMFLIFVLGRTNVLPLGDLAFRRTVFEVYRLRKPPTDERVLKIARPWEPYRSIGTWYCWALIDNNPGMW